jgi:hypothetical protein
VIKETEGRKRGEEAEERYDYSEGFAERARVALADPKLRGAVAFTSDNKVETRALAMESLRDPEGLRDLAAELRDAVLARLDEHLERLAVNWEAAGGRVFFAADAAEARDYICSVARKHSVRLTVKSKSMASEEIGLNQALAAQGIEAVETDLGEWIVQLAGEHPSHIVTPALHKTKEDVAQLFSEVAGERLPRGRAPPHGLRPRTAETEVSRCRDGNLRCQLRDLLGRCNLHRDQRGQRPDVHVASSGSHRANGYGARRRNVGRARGHAGVARPQRNWTEAHSVHEHPQWSTPRPRDRRAR